MSIPISIAIADKDGERIAYGSHPDLEQEDVIIHFDAEEGQPYKAPSRLDPIGDPAVDANCEITACYLQLRKDFDLKVPRELIGSDVISDWEAIIVDKLEEQKGELQRLRVS
jgi:hypothetical protein